MTIILWIIGILLGLFALLWINALRASFVRNKKINKKIKPALNAIKTSDPMAKEIIEELAQDPSIRNSLYAQLNSIDKASLFPKKFRTIMKVAESDLVRWLMHPNELKDVPSEIEFVKSFPVVEEEKTGELLLFKFKTEATHWASDYGWMAGVAGPYFPEEELPDYATGTFSELKPFDSMTSEEHIDHILQSMKSILLVVKA